MVDILHFGSGSLDPHIFAYPDPGSQNLAVPTDPDHKHCFKLLTHTPEITFLDWRENGHQEVNYYIVIDTYILKFIHFSPLKKIQKKT